MSGGTREDVKASLERWRYALEGRGMRVIRSKTKCICVNGMEDGRTVRLQRVEAARVDEFKYLGSSVQSNGECRKGEEEKAGWVE